VLLPFQRANHIPKVAKEITRKDRLFRRLALFARLYPSVRDAVTAAAPQTFVLPREYAQFAREGALRAGPWIVKPATSSRGRGILIAPTLSEVVYTQRAIVQTYVSNPLLYKGHKFDIRAFCLVFSAGGQLHAFLYRRSLARVCAKPFTMDAASLTDPYVHLTNAAINDHYVSPSAPEGNRPSDVPTKLDAAVAIRTACAEARRARLSASSPGKIQQAVEKAIHITFRAVTDISAGDLRICAETVPEGYFELIGFDLLPTLTGQAMIMEANASPGMSRTCSADDMKTGLIRDTLALVTHPFFGSRRSADFDIAAARRAVADAATNRTVGADGAVLSMVHRRPSGSGAISGLPAPQSASGPIEYPVAITDSWKPIVF
jgi:hypothetical protein